MVVTGALYQGSLYGSHGGSISDIPNCVMPTTWFGYNQGSL